VVKGGRPGVAKGGLFCGGKGGCGRDGEDETKFSQRGEERWPWGAGRGAKLGWVITYCAGEETREGKGGNLQGTLTSPSLRNLVIAS
jgi:hypothetical protein